MPVHQPPPANAEPAALLATLDAVSVVDDHSTDDDDLDHAASFMIPEWEHRTASRAVPRTETLILANYRDPHGVVTIDAEPGPAFDTADRPQTTIKHSAPSDPGCITRIPAQLVRASLKRTGSGRLAPDGHGL